MKYLLRRNAYLDRIRSNSVLSCGKTLWQRKQILLFEIKVKRFAIVPKARPKNGFHHCTTTKSTFSLFKAKATLSQLAGLTESMRAQFSSVSSRALWSYCVLPGNNNSGYCLLRVMNLTKCFLLSSLTSSVE